MNYRMTFAPAQVSATEDPDPYQNHTDLEHWFDKRITKGNQAFLLSYLILDHPRPPPPMASDYTCNIAQG
jgi:hypothetical protein